MYRYNSVKLFRGMKSLLTVVQPSPPPPSRAFSSSQTGSLSPVDTVASHGRWHPPSPSVSGG